MISQPLREVMGLFLKLGVLGFGGPIAIIAVLEEEAVRKRKWMSEQVFGEALALCKLLPGPISTQMSIYVGMLRAGTAGGVWAGILFVLPSFLLMLALSVLYFESAMVQRIPGFFESLQAGALAVILLSVWQLFRPFLRIRRAWTIGFLSAVMMGLFPRWEPLVILSFGLAGVFLGGGGGDAPVNPPRPRPRPSHALSLGFPGVAAALAGISGGAGPAFQVFWMAFKAGAFVFGTGLAIVPLFEADSVGHFGWLTHQQFMDGLALGQITPGPVVITATFIGFKAAGYLGALVATLGVFLPSFINILVILPHVRRRIAGTPGAARFTSWALPSVVGCILGSSLKLGVLSLRDPISIALFVSILVLSLRVKLPAWVLIPAAGVVGTVIHVIAF